jgi:hypothetical protein
VQLVGRLTSFFFDVVVKSLPRNTLKMKPGRDTAAYGLGEEQY